MSCTEIYSFNKDGKISFYGEANNSWLDAMFIWNRLEEKYLPSLPKICDFHKEEEYIHRFKLEEMREIWSLVNSEKILEHEKIVMLTTFDYGFAKRTDLEKVIAAFEKFINEFESDNLKQQIELFKEIEKDDGIYCIGWCQTSVNSYLSDYNLNAQKHWFLFEEEQ